MPHYFVSVSGRRGLPARGEEGEAGRDVGGGPGTRVVA